MDSANASVIRSREHSPKKSSGVRRARIRSRQQSQTTPDNAEHRQQGLVDLRRLLDSCAQVSNESQRNSRTPRQGRPAGSTCEQLFEGSFRKETDDSGHASATPGPSGTEGHSWGTDPQSEHASATLPNIKEEIEVRGAHRKKKGVEKMSASDSARSSKKSVLLYTASYPSPSGSSLLVSKYENCPKGQTQTSEGESHSFSIIVTDDEFSPHRFRRHRKRSHDTKVLRELVGSDEIEKEIKDSLYPHSNVYDKILSLGDHKTSVVDLPERRKGKLRFAKTKKHRFRKALQNIFCCSRKNLPSSSTSSSTSVEKQSRPPTSHHSVEAKAIRPKAALPTQTVMTTMLLNQVEPFLKNESTQTSSISPLDLQLLALPEEEKAKYKRMLSAKKMNKSTITEHSENLILMKEHGKYTVPVYVKCYTTLAINSEKDGKSRVVTFADNDVTTVVNGDDGKEHVFHRKERLPLHSNSEHELQSVPFEKKKTYSRLKITNNPSSKVSTNVGAISPWLWNDPTMLFYDPERESNPRKSLSKFHSWHEPQNKSLVKVNRKTDHLHHRNKSGDNEENMELLFLKKKKLKKKNPKKVKSCYTVDITIPADNLYEDMVLDNKAQTPISKNKNLDFANDVLQSEYSNKVVNVSSHISKDLLKPTTTAKESELCNVDYEFPSSLGVSAPSSKRLIDVTVKSAMKPHPETSVDCHTLLNASQATFEHPPLLTNEIMMHDLEMDLSDESIHKLSATEKERGGSNVITDLHEGGYNILADENVDRYISTEVDRVDRTTIVSNVQDKTQTPSQHNMKCSPHASTRYSDRNMPDSLNVDNIEEGNASKIKNKESEGKIKNQEESTHQVDISVKSDTPLGEKKTSPNILNTPSFSKKTQSNEKCTIDLKDQREISRYPKSEAKGPLEHCTDNVCPPVKEPAKTRKKLKDQTRDETKALPEKGDSSRRDPVEDFSHSSNEGEIIKQQPKSKPKASTPEKDEEKELSQNGTDKRSPRKYVATNRRTRKENLMGERKTVVPEKEHGNEVHRQPYLARKDTSTKEKNAKGQLAHKRYASTPAKIPEETPAHSNGTKAPYRKDPSSNRRSVNEQIASTKKNITLDKDTRGKFDRTKSFFPRDKLMNALHDREHRGRVSQIPAPEKDVAEGASQNDSQKKPFKRVTLLTRENRKKDARGNRKVSKEKAPGFLPARGGELGRSETKQLENAEEELTGEQRNQSPLNGQAQSAGISPENLVVQGPKYVAPAPANAVDQVIVSEGQRDRKNNYRETSKPASANNDNIENVSSNRSLALESIVGNDKVSPKRDDSARPESSQFVSGVQTNTKWPLETNKDSKGRSCMPMEWEKDGWSRDAKYNPEELDISPYPHQLQLPELVAKTENDNFLHAASYHTSHESEMINLIQLDRSNSSSEETKESSKNFRKKELDPNRENTERSKGRRKIQNKLSHSHTDFPQNDEGALRDHFPYKIKLLEQTYSVISSETLTQRNLQKMHNSESSSQSVAHSVNREERMDPGAIENITSSPVDIQNTTKHSGLSLSVTDNASQKIHDEPPSTGISSPRTSTARTQAHGVASSPKDEETAHNYEVVHPLIEELSLSVIENASRNIRDESPSTDISSPRTSVTARTQPHGVDSSPKDEEIAQNYEDTNPHTAGSSSVADNASELQITNANQPDTLERESKLIRSYDSPVEKYEYMKTHSDFWSPGFGINVQLTGHALREEYTLPSQCTQKSTFQTMCERFCNIFPCCRQCSRSCKKKTPLRRRNAKTKKYLKNNHPFTPQTLLNERAQENAVALPVYENRMPDTRAENSTERNFSCCSSCYYDVREGTVKQRPKPNVAGGRQALEAMKAPIRRPPRNNAPHHSAYNQNRNRRFDGDSSAWHPELLSGKPPQTYNGFKEFYRPPPENLTSDRMMDHQKSSLTTKTPYSLSDSRDTLNFHTHSNNFILMCCQVHRRYPALIPPFKSHLH